MVATKSTGNNAVGVVRIEHNVVDPWDTTVRLTLQIVLITTRVGQEFVEPRHKLFRVGEEITFRSEFLGV